MEVQPKIVHPLKPILRLGAPLIAFFFIQNSGQSGDPGDRQANWEMRRWRASKRPAPSHGVVLALLFGFDTGVQARCLPDEGRRP